MRMKNSQANLKGQESAKDFALKKMSSRFEVFLKKSFRSSPNLRTIGILFGLRWRRSGLVQIGNQFEGETAGRPGPCRLM